MGGTATNVLGLGTRDVDVLEQDLHGRIGDRHGLGGSDLLVDVAASLLVEPLEVLLSSDTPVKDPLLESGNGVVGGAHALDLLTGTVGGTGVGHGVTTVTVGDVLENHGALLGASPLLSVLDGGLDSEDVHAVDLETRDVLTTLVVLGEGGRAGSGGTHTVLVVWNAMISRLSHHAVRSSLLTLTAEQGGELPELGHVESLEDLTLVASTVTVQDDAGLAVLVVLVGESETSTNGDLRTDDTVTAVEALGEHVHGTTLAVGNTLAATEKLTNDGANGATTHHGETVATVGSDNIVLLGDGVLDTNGDSLLTGGQMAETANLLLLVQPIGSHLHLPTRELVSQ